MYILQTNKQFLSATTLVGVTLLSIYAYRYWQRHRIPKKWRRVGILQAIHVFPVKSCGELQLEPDAVIACDVLAARVNEIYDRRLMLVDDENNMISARIYPQMVLINPVMVGPNKLRLQMPSRTDMEDLELDYAELAAANIGQINTIVNSAPVAVNLCGSKYDQWFSEAILQRNSGLKLVYYPYETAVKNKQRWQSKEPYLRQTDTGTLSDATSYHLINLASLLELNTRTDKPVDALQFRANWDIKTDIEEPYAEDNWQWIKIGEQTIFRNIAPCPRCILPNINARSGTRDTKNQPLTTLNKYRKWKNYNAPIFGIHLGIRQAGTVKLNDVVYVEDN